MAVPKKPVKKKPSPKKKLELPSVQKKKKLGLLKEK